MVKSSHHVLLAESECVGLSARIKEPDLKSALRDCALLPDQLVEPLTGHDSRAVGINVRAMVRARRRTIDGDLESDRLAIRSGTQNKVKVPGTVSVDDAAALFLKGRMLVVDGPLAGKSPFVQPRRPGRIDVARVGNGTVWRNEVLRSFVAEIGLRRHDVGRV